MEKLRYRVWNIEAAGYEDLMDVIGISPDCKYIYFKELDEPDAIFVETIKGKYIIEQYTGLNDKHRKDIYEGDIIRVQNGEHTMLSTEKKADASQVVFEWGAFRYLSDSMIENTMEYLYPYNLEVIGNIHENKELIK